MSFNQGTTNKNRAHAMRWSWLLALLLPLATQAAALAPQELIMTHSEQLVDALQKQGDAIKTDRAIALRLVEEIVLPHVDFDRVAQLVLGKYWRTASPEQRQRFQQEFKDLLVRTYVTAMIEFSDQIISHARDVRYLPVPEGNDDKYSTVRMEIRMPNRPPVQIGYRLFNGNGAWKIYDVTVEGVSLATTYRSSFATEIRRGGLDQLIGRLSERNQELSAAVPKPAP